MASDIAIVIQGVDQFSPTFQQLEAALERAEGVLRALSERQGESMTALTEQQQGALADLGERLHALQAALDERRIAQEQRANARVQHERAAHLAALVALEQRNAAQLAAFESAALSARLTAFRGFTLALHALAASQGRAMAQAAKTLAAAQALIDTYLAANAALAQVPYPFNFLAAAAVTAQGLANVQRIQQVSIAHGGLDRVPEDATFLLKQGERVIAPRQNRDLTAFLDAQPPAAAPGMTVQNLTVHVLERATNAESLLTMDRAELRRVVAERVIPALDELARLGIRPDFVESGT